MRRAAADGARVVRVSDDSADSRGQARSRLRSVEPGADSLPADDPVLSERFRDLERDVFRVCRRLLDSSAAADDAVNEVYLRARRAIASYDPSRPFRPWLLGIASNHCIDQLRRRKVETRIFDGASPESDGPIDPGPSPLSQVVDGEERAAVLAAIDELPAHYRLPLVLRYWSDLDYSQIGEVLGVPRGQVGSLLFRARRALRTSLVTGSDS